MPTTKGRALCGPSEFFFMRVNRHRLTRLSLDLAGFIPIPSSASIPPSGFHPKRPNIQSGKYTLTALSMNDKVKASWLYGMAQERCHPEDGGIYGTGP